MKTIRQILDDKGSDYWHVSPGTTVYEAVRLMAEQEIGSVLVMDGDMLKGILTERDYARKVVLEGLSSPELPVERIMSTNVLYARPDQSVDECMALMTDKRVRHLPVIDAGTVVGIVSIGDMVKAVIDEQQFIIEQLEQYIAG
jgi:CBS domain-containing protein